MPVMNGFECTRRIRELEKNGVLHGHLPIIALTANVSAESRQECASAGADHFLAKPLSMKDLQDSIERFATPLEPTAATNKENAREPPSGTPAGR